MNGGRNRVEVEEKKEEGEQVNIYATYKDGPFERSHALGSTSASKSTS